MSEQKETIFLTTKTAHLIEVCRKLKLSEDKEMNAGIFLKYMLIGISSRQTFVLVAPKDDSPDKINGYAVITIMNNLENNHIWIDSMWTDGMDIEFMTVIEDFARTLDITKIHAKTKKNLKGFKELYRVVEKLL
ncbi:hypothetical protein FP828_03595 [bacterium]|nr:hypothetical protein [Candidatus Omnitrophota bacterium]MBA3065557.1 hypothetical protein [bacterium]